MVDNLPKRKVLDIGFSDFGRGLNYAGVQKGPYAPKGTTIGLDPHLLDIDTPFRQIEGIGEDLPFEDSTLDRITSRYVIGGPADIKGTISEIVRTLKPGGSANFTVTVEVSPSEKDIFNKSRLVRYLKTLPLRNLRVTSKHSYKDNRDIVIEVLKISFRKR